MSLVTPISGQVFHQNLASDMSTNLSSPLDKEAFPNLNEVTAGACDMEVIKELKRDYALMETSSP